MRTHKQLFLLLLVMVLLLGYLGYVVYTKKVPCVTPISYGVVSLDPKFKLSDEEAQADVDRAAQMWNDALGSQVLVVGVHPELPVYFVYETTQRITDELTSLDRDIDQAKQEATQAANEYATLKKLVDDAMRTGSPAPATEVELGALLNKYYKALARVNADVAKSRNAVPQGDITEGEYKSDNGAGKMYIYGFQTKTQLVRALAHEFGHALGLDHVANADSILYPLNMSDSLTLSPEDLAEMKKVCGIR